MQNAETPQGETQSAEALGTEQLPATGSETQPESKADVQPVDSVDPKTETNTVDPEVEKLRKENQKLEMERNMLRNKQQEEEVERLKESENYKELAERYQNELTEIQQKQEEKEAIEEARAFRDEVIDSYPDQRTKEMAKKLLAKNPSAIVWGNVETFDDAKAQLVEQLDSIKETINPNNEADPVVVGNNPAPSAPQQIERSEAVELAARNRDFTEVLASIPSVQEQMKSVEQR